MPRPTTSEGNSCCSTNSTATRASYEDFDVSRRRSEAITLGRPTISVFHLIFEFGNHLISFAFNIESRHESEKNIWQKEVADLAACRADADINWQVAPNGQDR
jgi:hypothetical protein